MANIYWVNGTGNWQDQSHWSTSSGGVSGASIPTSASDVVFDQNSFTDGGQEVTVSAAECHSMTWQNAPFLPTLIFSDDTTSQCLTAHGNITFQNSMYVDYRLPINISLFANYINNDVIDPCIIIAGVCHLTNATIPLPPITVLESATLTLEDNFIGSTLNINGSFDAQEHNITVKAIKINPTTAVIYNIRIINNGDIRIDSNGNIRISILE